MSAKKNVIDLINKMARDLGLSPSRRSSFLWWRIPKHWKGTKYAFGYTPWKTEDDETNQCGFFACKYRIRKDGSMRLVKKVRFGKRRVAKERSLLWHNKYYGENA